MIIAAYISFLAAFAARSTARKRFARCQRSDPNEERLCAEDCVHTIFPPELKDTLKKKDIEAVAHCRERFQPRAEIREAGSCQYSVLQSKSAFDEGLNA
jgi:hypothetical protein